MILFEAYFDTIFLFEEIITDICKKKIYHEFPCSDEEILNYYNLIHNKQIDFNPINVFNDTPIEFTLRFNENDDPTIYEFATPDNTHLSVDDVQPINSTTNEHLEIAKVLFSLYKLKN